VTTFQKASAMNAKQRRKFKKLAIETIKEAAREFSPEECLTELVMAQAQLTRWEKYRHLRVKLGDDHGSILAGHWFYLVPADEYAAKALEDHRDR